MERAHGLFPLNIKRILIVFVQMEREEATDA